MKYLHFEYVKYNMYYVYYKNWYWIWDNVQNSSMPGFVIIENVI